MKHALTCGSWPSPLSAARISMAGVRLSQPRSATGMVYWLESRPAENGRSVLVWTRPGEAPRDLTPAPFSVRSRVHEYGGGAYTISKDTAYFVNDMDQQIYTQALPDGTPRPLTHAPGCRFADLLVDERHAQLLVVCEQHSVNGDPPRNTLMAVSLNDGRVSTLAQGYDFYSSPALSPDGRQLAWLCWNQPQMPWDGCELWLAELDNTGKPAKLRCVAGGTEEAIFQPQFAPDGVLHFISDRNGYWNLYRHAAGTDSAITEDQMDHGFAQWNFGMSSYGFPADGTLLATRIHDGESELVRIRRQGGIEILNTGCTQIEHLHAQGPLCALLAANPYQSACVFAGTPGEFTQLNTTDNHIERGYLSAPQFICFPTTNGETAYAWYYPPHHPGYCALPDEKPPLLVKCHGGPTAMNGNGLEAKIRFWTSRGFAVADVNYRGSSGFGRAYRQSLHGEWGIKDAEDCIAAARYLVNKGLADPQRLAISGGSAGGYTVLCALAFHDYFRAGAVYYGISELASAMRDTHKFEARYGDSLLGPWPEARAAYRARSPLYAAGNIRCPVIFFQGLKDKVVPPDQTERMVAALRANAVPVEYLSFPEEAHGFRRRETLERTLEAELAFYGRAFGFTPAASAEPA